MKELYRSFAKQFEACLWVWRGLSIALDRSDGEFKSGRLNQRRYAIS